MATAPPPRNHANAVAPYAESRTIASAPPAEYSDYGIRHLAYLLLTRVSVLWLQLSWYGTGRHSLSAIIPIITIITAILTIRSVDLDMVYCVRGTTRFNGGSIASHAQRWIRAVEALAHQLR